MFFNNDISDLQNIPYIYLIIKAYKFFILRLNLLYIKNMYDILRYYVLCKKYMH
jgi:hypothetical protein